MARRAVVTGASRESLSIAGIYEALIRCSCARQADLDPRDTDDLDDTEYAAALAEAKAEAKRRADEQIQAGKPLGPMLIHTGRMLHPWERDTFVVPSLVMFGNRMIVVSADDRVVYDAEATEASKARVVAEEANRLAAVAQAASDAAVRNGHNGSEVTIP